MKTIFLCTLFYLGGMIISYGQYAVSNSTPCQGEEVLINYNGDPMEFFGSCFNGQSTTSYFWKLEIDYPNGTYTLSNGVYTDILLTAGDFGFTVETVDWNNPGTIEVKITGYRSTDGIMDNAIPCVDAEVTFQIDPKPGIHISGLSSIVSNDELTYSVDVVPGATNYAWSVPPNWTIVSGQNTNSISVLPSGNGGDVEVFVSPLPTEISCANPAIKSVTVSDCFNTGITDYPFCDPEIWSTDFTTAAYGDKNKFPRRVGDFNGDGKDDIIGFGNTNVFVGVSTGIGFQSSPWIAGFAYGLDGSTQDKFPRKIGDFNGDGMDDIIGFGYDKTFVGISTGTSFSTALFTPYQALSFSDGYTDRKILQRLIGDFDGNGMDDIISFGHNEHDVAISTGTSFDASLWSGNAEFSSNNSWLDFDRYTRLVGDFNGDGKDDIVGFLDDGTYVGISTGTSFTTWQWTSSFSVNDGMEQKNYPRMVGDFNGDGMDDIIGFGENQVNVGISTGNGFVVSTWTTKAFTRATGWFLDAREIGVVSENELGDHFQNNSSFVGADEHLLHLDEIEIADANGDGMDDVIGFGYAHLTIAYSNGDSFQCPDKLAEEFTNTYYVGPPIPYVSLSSQDRTPYYTASKDVRTVGNFDNTDDAVEIIGFDETKVEVMNCDFCGDAQGSVAFVDYVNITQETGYSEWTVDVYEQCEQESITLDVSGTTCEDRYRVLIYEFDLATWTSTEVFNTGWIVTKVPDQINIGTLYTFGANQLYLVSLEVGPEWNSTNVWMRMKEPDAELQLSPNFTKVEQTKALQLYTVNEFCDSQTSFNALGSFSSCYEQYRFELVEVSTSTLGPIGNPIQNVPSSGGWTNGVSMPTHIPIPMTNMISGKLYRLRIFVKNSVGEEYVSKYVRKVNCPDDRRRVMSSNNRSLIEKKTSQVYPNPTDGAFSIVPFGHHGEKIQLEILSIHGQVLLSTRIANEGAPSKINLDGIAPGAYTMRLSSKSRVETIPLLKK